MNLKITLRKQQSGVIVEYLFHDSQCDVINLNQVHVCSFVSTLCVFLNQLPDGNQRLNTLATINRRFLIGKQRLPNSELQSDHIYTT